ncbi:MAG: 5'/3'-nucleotidase SurE [Gammaproteobacteria bacterium]|nr:5'/3'-nucleotidase SurE [Gammaproteobacteria bacterium]
MRIAGFINRVLLLAVVTASLAAPGCATQQVSSETTALRILLTNDDGYDAPGIQALRAALVAAGHDVILVAPLQDQSGSGARVTTQGTLDYKEQSAGVWSVDGSPADSVLIGLLHIMGDESPDLVVSGANFGQNLGYAINSGTVGAATVAMYVGIPAIAVSVGVDLSERDAEPAPFPSTLQAFAGAAELSVKLIGDLQKAPTDKGDLLPEHTLLNINYPAAAPEQIRGIRVLQAARTSGVQIDYEETGVSGQLEIRIRGMTPAVTDSDDTDWHLFARGFVTISVLDGDWDAGESWRDALSSRLSMVGQP